MEVAVQPEVAVARLQGRARETPSRPVLPRPRQAFLPAVAAAKEATPAVVARHVEKEEKVEAATRGARDRSSDPANELAEGALLAPSATGAGRAAVLAVLPVPRRLLVSKVVP